MSWDVLDPPEHFAFSIVRFTGDKVTSSLMITRAGKKRRESGTYRKRC